MPLSLPINLSRHVTNTVLRPGRKHLSSIRLQSTIHGSKLEDSEPTYRSSIAQANSMTEIGIREIFNSDHDILRQSARKFWNEEMKPHYEQWEKDGIMPKEFFKLAGDAGLLCCMVPEEYGGPGGDILDQAVMCEEQSYSGCNAPGFSAHSILPVPYILRFGNEEAKQKYLPDMVAGTTVGCLAITEPAAGSDLQGMKTTAVRDGDDWILNGSKTFISNGINSDIAVVAALTDPAAKSNAHGMGLFIVDCNAEGFKRGRNLKKMGLKGLDTAELFFEDVRVPASNVVGDPTKGFHMMMESLPLERLVIAIIYQASAEFMFEETRTYIKERKAFGKPLVKLQVVGHKMADLKIQICAARTFTDHCIKLCKDGLLNSSTASMSKTLSSELACTVAHECLQLHGGYGYMDEYPISRAFRDTRIGTIYAGPNEIMKELIARTIAS